MKDSLLKRKTLLLPVLAIILAAGAISIFQVRYFLWKREGVYKEIGAYLIAAPGHLYGCNKNEIVRRLGQPDYKSDRYALLLLRDSEMVLGTTPDLVIQLDSSNCITRLTYAWQDFAPSRTNSYDGQRWKTSSIEAKISMSADLLAQWRNGGMSSNLSTLSQAEMTLGKLMFVDEWRYGFKEFDALMIDFNAAGTVVSARIGADD